MSEHIHVRDCFEMTGATVCGLKSAAELRCETSSAISDLERAVVEAAENFQRDFAWSGQFANSDAMKAYNSLMESVDALIAAREKGQS